MRMDRHCFPWWNGSFDKKEMLRHAVEIVQQSDGMERTKELAQVHAELAMEAALDLGDSVHRDALVHLAYKVVDRTR